MRSGPTSSPFHRAGQDSPPQFGEGPQLSGTSSSLFKEIESSSGRTNTREFFAHFF